MGVKLGSTRIHRASKDIKCRKDPHCTQGGTITAGNPYVMCIRWTKKKKRWYRNLHLECFVSWAEFLLERRESKSLNGRPPGTGRLYSLSLEERKQRGSLVRRRAALIRKVIVEEDGRAIETFWKMIEKIHQEIADTGIPLQKGMQSHRSDENTALFTQKTAKYTASTLEKEWREKQKAKNNAKTSM